MKPVFDTFIFDLDRTLYPFSSSILRDVDKKITGYCQNLLGISFYKADQLRQDYYLAYGSTLGGLIAHHHVDPEEYLDVVHDVDYTSLEVCEHLKEQISRLDGRKLIYTNGTKKHAKAVLEKRKISHFFEAIHDIKSANYVAKPSVVAFEEFLEIYNINPKTAIFFDDSMHNTRVAKQLGIYSVLVYEGMKARAGDHSAENSHETVYDLSKFLEQNLLQNMSNS